MNTKSKIIEYGAEPKIEYDALVVCLPLAITAPEGKEEDAKWAIDYAEELAAKFDEETGERAKADAVIKAEVEFGDAWIELPE